MVVRNVLSLLIDYRVIVTCEVIVIEVCVMYYIIRHFTVKGLNAS